MIAEDAAKAVWGFTGIGVSSPTSPTEWALKDGLIESHVRTSSDDKGVSSPSEQPSREEQKAPIPPHNIEYLPLSMNW